MNNLITGAVNRARKGLIYSIFSSFATKNGQNPSFLLRLQGGIFELGGERGSTGDA